MNDTAETLIAYSRENNRVCPQPDRWNELWLMLPNRIRIGNGWEPPLPLILAAWHDTPAMQKMVRTAEQIEWADKHGKLAEVSIFLRSLAESDWQHLGD